MVLPLATIPLPRHHHRELHLLPFLQRIPPPLRHRQVALMDSRIMVLPPTNPLKGTDLASPLEVLEQGMVGLTSTPAILDTTDIMDITVEVAGVAGVAEAAVVVAVVAA